MESVGGETVGGFGNGTLNNSPAGELGSTKEEAKHWVEEKHLSKGILPFFKPFLGVGKEITDKSEWCNHDEDGDDTLTEANRDDANEDGNDDANQSN